MPTAAARACRVRQTRSTACTYNMKFINHGVSLNRAFYPSGRVQQCTCRSTARNQVAGVYQAQEPLACCMTASVPINRPVSDVNQLHIPLTVVYGFAVVGLMSVISMATSGVKFAWRQYLRPAKELSRYGKWAIVTGATGGIGRAYCDYLAKQGLNILLISRSQSKLEQAASEISSQNGVDTSCLAVDLEVAGTETMDESMWTQIKAAVADKDVGVLVNNAGTSHDPAHLHDIEPAAIDRVIAVNNSSVVKLTHLILPGMVSRGRGAIVNISTSFTTAIPAAPFISLYTASKGFIDTFSKALSAEYTPLGIDVQVVAPGPVNTDMLRLERQTTLSVPTADTYVRSAGRHIGYEPEAVPYPMHAYNTFVAKLLPDHMAIDKVKAFAKKRTADLAKHDAAVAAAAQDATG